MKKIVFILAMLLTAATSYNQSFRKTTNAEYTAQKQERTRNNKNATTQPRNQQQRNESKSSNQSQSRQRQSDERTKTEPRSNNLNDNNRQREDRTRSESAQPSRENNHERNNVSTSQEVKVRANRTNEYRHVNREYTSPRVDRERREVVHHYDRPPVSREYRRYHYVYRAPVGLNIYWTQSMHNYYVRIYPMVRVWEYPIGYRIEAIPAYYANYYKGAVMTVYGQISEVYYSRVTDEYFLYMGPYYPYQDITIVMPGWIARQYSSRPSLFFDNQNLAVTGLITTFEGEPEIVVRETFQLNLY